MLRSTLAGRCLAALATVGLSAGLLTAAAPAGATTPLARPLPLVNVPSLTDPQAMIDVAGHLFVTDGNTVTVLSETGTVVKKFTGMFGAATIVASPSGNRVYVALPGASSIAVIDTGALRVVGTWAAGPCTRGVALVGSRLFYSYGCADQPDLVASMDAATGGDIVAADLGRTGLTDGVAPAVLAGLGSTLAVALPDIDPVQLETFTVDGTTLKPLAAFDGVADNLHTLALADDGASVLLASGAPYELQEYHSATFAPEGSWTTGPYPTALAVSHDGTLIAGGTDPGDADGHDLEVFGRITGSETDRGSASAMTIQPSTVTFAADDKTVFALAASSTGSPGFALTSIGSGPAVASTIALTVTPPHTVATALTATATVPGHPHEPVAFTVTAAGRPLQRLALTDAHSVARLSARVSGGGTVTAAYAGNAYVAAAVSRTIRFAVSATLRLSLAPPSVLGGSLLATARLENRPGKAVLFRVTHPGHPDQTVYKDTDSTGLVQARFYGNLNGGTITASYLGDQYLAPTTTPPIAFRVPPRLTVSVNGFYGLVHAVRYFHTNRDVHVDIVIIPATAASVVVVLQRQTGTRWVNAQSHRTPLTGGRAVLAPAALTSRVLYRYVVTFTGDATAKSRQQITPAFRVD